MTKTLPKESQALVNFIIEKFNAFNPKTDSKDVLPRKVGNYVVLLKKETPFPTAKVNNVPVIREIKYNGKEYQLIYTGIIKPTSKKRNLRKRISNHIGDNAGHSTLKLSLGCLMGFTKIYRDKSLKNKKFRKLDEHELSNWIQNNLLFLYYENPNCDNDEGNMITALNPPLNIDLNYCKENAEFRSELRYLRSAKTQFEPIIE